MVKGIPGNLSKKQISVTQVKRYLCLKYMFPFKILGGHQSFLVGPLIPLFKTSGDICGGFQSQGGFPRLHVLMPACNGFHRFTSGATPVDLFMASMAANPL